MQSVAHRVRCRAAQLSHAFHKLCLVHREDLGYVHHGCLRKIGFAFLQKHVARRLRPAQVRGNQTHDAGCNRAPVENIVLHNHARMPVRWCRTSRRSKIKPVHLSLLNHAYQRSLTARRTLVLIPFSRGCPAGGEPPARTWLRRSSICSCRWRCRKSLTAIAKSRLRLNPSSRAVSSASCNSPSSMEIAVFIGTTNNHTRVHTKQEYRRMPNWACPGLPLPETSKIFAPYSSIIYRYSTPNLPFRPAIVKVA